MFPRVYSALSSDATKRARSSNLLYWCLFDVRSVAYCMATGHAFTIVKIYVMPFDAWPGQTTSYTYGSGQNIRSTSTQKLLIFQK